MADNKVKFLRGTSNEYTAAKKDSDTIYFTTNDGKLYIGDKEVSGSDITIDDTLSNTSTNPVQNKVIKQAIDNKADKTVATTSADGLMSAEDKGKLDAFEITTTGGKLHDKDIATTDLIPTTLPANGGNSDTVNNKKIEIGLYTNLASFGCSSTDTAQQIWTSLPNYSIYIDVAQNLTDESWKFPNGPGQCSIMMIKISKNRLAGIYLYPKTNGDIYWCNVDSTGNFAGNWRKIANSDSNPSVQLTYAEYRALSYDQQHNGTTYYITDADSAGDNMVIVSPPTSINSIMNTLIYNPSNRKIKIKLIGDSITQGAKGTGQDKSGKLILKSGISIDKSGHTITVDDGEVGDKISEWYINVNGHCWANSLKAYLEKKYNCEVVNYGCGGFSSYNVINHIYELIEEDDDIIIVTIGTNDRTMIDTIHNKATSIQTYTDNLQTIYDFCKGKGKKIIFMSNLPAGSRNEEAAGEMPKSPSEALQYASKAAFPTTGDSSKVYFDKSTGIYWRWIQTGGETISYAYAEVKHFHMEDVDAAINAFAYRNNIEYISMYQLFNDYCFMIGEDAKIETYLADNLHPNDKGYDIMFYLLCKALGVPVPSAQVKHNWR